MLAQRSSSSQLPGHTAARSSACRAACACSSAMRVSCQAVQPCSRIHNRSNELQVGINSAGVAMSATESFGNARKALTAGEARLLLAELDCFGISVQG